jgi:hypothetical protein
LRSDGVQEGADLVEQFVEVEWLCQELEAAQIVGAVVNGGQ